LRQKQEREAAEAAELAAAEARKYHPPETLGIIAEHKSKFIRYLVLWLASAPLSIGMYLGLDKVFKSDIPVFRNVPAMIIIFVLALYGLLGWIPLMILYIRKASI
jgi:hypothetical protein